MQHRLQSLGHALRQFMHGFASIQRSSGDDARTARNLAPVSAIPLLAAVLLLAFPSAAHAAWRPPVAGPVVRGFLVGPNPYGGGQHRGIDLLAPPGATVRAPCEGRVLVAGRVGTSGGVVTLLCGGRWRVSQMPLTGIAVRAGVFVTPGARLGTVARGHDHAGLHLGVRRDGARFGYVDPLRFLAPTPTGPAPPLGRAPRDRRSTPPHSPAPSPVVQPTVERSGAPETAAHRSSPSRAQSGGGLAPWPAWAGLGLVLAGLGLRWRGSIRTRTRRRLRAPATVNQMTPPATAQLGPLPAAGKRMRQ